jgi:hypothetical protein
VKWQDSQFEVEPDTVSINGGPQIQHDEARAPAEADRDQTTTELATLDAALASRLREQAGAILLYATLKRVFTDVSFTAIQAFRDALLTDSGAPTDPVEVMLIEQIASAHLNIGSLQFKAANADSIEVARAFGTLAAELLAEFRRLCLALQSYRVTARQLRSPAAIDRPARQLPRGESGEAGPDSEVGSNQEPADVDSTVVQFATEEPEARGGRPAQRPAPKRAVG